MGPKVVPFAIDESTARARFLARITAGALRPGDLRQAGTIKAATALYLPARSVTASVVSNWTGESGTNGPRGMVWTPLSGQHRETYGGLAFLVARGHDGFAAQQSLKHISRAVPATDELLAGGRSVEATETADETLQRATQLVTKREIQACRRMIPGAAKRNVKVNTTVESHELATVSLPFWEVKFEYSGTTSTGWVDGATGAVFATGPTSMGRVAVLAGSIVGVIGAAVAAFFLVTSLFAAISAAEVGRLADEQRARAEAEQEAQRVAREAEITKLRDEAGSNASAAQKSLGEADAALGTGDVLAARGALEALNAVVSQYDEIEPMPEAMVPYVGQSAPREQHLSALTSQATAKSMIDAKDYIAASAALSDALTTLGAIDPGYAGSGAVKKLVSRVTSTQKSIQGKVEAQRREIAEAEAMRVLCGDAPEPDGWDGGLIAVDRYMKDRAHDPSSIDSSECTRPVLTNQCWRTSCTVRGTNMFGALIANNYTFYLGRHPESSILNLVLAVEE